MLRLNRLFVLIVPIIFFVIGLFNLSDYGINWDEPKHMIRGQSYLHFILTGKRDFLDAPSYPKMRRSYFQSDFYTFDYFMTKHVHTHPEVNDLFSAFSNFIFYQKLGWLGDIESYHLFVVMATFLLVVAVALWTWSRFGIFASIVASCSLVLYPLVFSDSHFNFKDPPLMAFFGLAILTFWFGFSKKKVKYIIASALFAGLALGTKFNTVFLPLVLGPWLIFFVYKRRGKKVKSLWDYLGGKNISMSILLYPFIMLTVLYVFSPYFWPDPVGRFIDTINYYKEVGTGTPTETPYLFYGWNLYPLIWIAYATPLPILFFSTIGFLYSLALAFRKGREETFLLVLWFLVPIGRAILPNMNILGDVRHIMEFFPAMAIFAGVGVYAIAKLVKNYSTKTKWVYKITVLIVTASYVFVAWELIRIHPNENVYYNQLIGGLQGAQAKNLPLWGNSFGNVYLQGINWLNNNAEPNARVALGWNYISSIPRLKLRDDISLDNNHWSGPRREGEYIMEMHYNNPLQQRYKYAYYETFLNPVYEVKVDGVPLLKIWKNDIEHVRKGYADEKVFKPDFIRLEGQKLRLDFENEVFLTRLIIDHSTSSCDWQGMEGFISVSQDGKNWVREQGALFDPESPYASPGMDEDTFVYMFPARPVRSMIFNSQMVNSCVLKNFKVTVWGLAK